MIGELEVKGRKTHVRDDGQRTKDGGHTIAKRSVLGILHEHERGSTGRLEEHIPVGQPAARIHSEPAFLKGQIEIQDVLAMPIGADT